MLSSRTPSVVWGMTWLARRCLVGMVDCTLLHTHGSISYQGSLLLLRPQTFASYLEVGLWNKLGC